MTSKKTKKLKKFIVRLTSPSGKISEVREVMGYDVEYIDGSENSVCLLRIVDADGTAVYACHMMDVRDCIAEEAMVKGLHVIN